jgi:hypothetical protein
MRWTVESESDGELIIVRTSGRFDVESHRLMIEDIVSREFWRPGRHVLFDHRALDWGGTGIDDMRAAQANHAAYDDRIGEGRAAILMGDVASFGIGRQFEQLSEDAVSARLHVFSDEDQARFWLRHGGS